MHNSPFAHRGFTLIELLVVISIIVLLLSLLAPALDRAVYAAELTVCGASHKVLATAVTDYAMGNDRRYPYRRAVHEAQQWPMNICYGRPEYDERPVLSQYMQMNKVLNCPMSDQLDIEGSLPTSYVFAAYNLWYGMQFRDANGLKSGGMLRLGDKLSWEDTGYAMKVKTPLISGTRYTPNKGGYGSNWVSSSHPGKNGTYTSVVYQDALAAPYTYTYMRWDSYSPDKGLVDLNFSYADLSVQRVDDAHWDPAVDDRMFRIPAFSNSATYPTDWWETIPKN